MSAAPKTRATAAVPGYLTDVEYTGNFYAHLAPAWLSYIAAINGYGAPSIGGRYAWCELGCGKGVTSLLLAATHPTGEFYACDFNRAHIAYAESLRRAAGVENVRFYAKSFAEMLGEDLPPLDFIVLHGVYSWVPETVRSQIREFIRRKLRLGGLVMVSYNAMPGWAHLQPIRQMMRAYAETLPGDALEQTRQAFAYVSFLAENGATYFKTSPAAASHLKGMSQHDIRYIAHEYLTPHGDPFYFAEVESTMRSVGLTFAGNMSPADNYPELTVPKRMLQLVATAPTRAVREVHCDFIANRAFRSDLYAAQPDIDQPTDLPLARLEGMAFALTDLSERLPLKRDNGGLRFDLEDQRSAIRAVHALLANGPATARAIHRTAGKRTEGETSFLIQQLVVSQHLVPCPLGRASPGWTRVNAALVDAALREQLQQVPLACANTGSASYCEPVYAATIEAAAQCADAGTASERVLARLRGYGHPVNKHTIEGTQQPATDEEVLRYVAATWHSFQQRAHPSTRLLRLFGILA